jgi:DNA-binding CsgD family transcriptional regulator
MKFSADGLVLLGPSLQVLYANAEAIGVLVYPQDPRRVAPAAGLLDGKVRSVLLKRAAAPEEGFVDSVTSGRRAYRCRAFALRPRTNGAPEGPTVAILIERAGKLAVDTLKLAEQFKLTQRERETVDYLLQGLTSKEIATRMKISPNTVKAFLRLIMVKMGTTTRSGILGKIFEVTQ